MEEGLPPAPHQNKGTTAIGFVDLRFDKKEERNEIALLE